MVVNWLRSFYKSSRETKWFVLNWFIYGLAIVATSIYCYARLDFVRSYTVTPPAPQAPTPLSETPSK